MSAESSRFSDGENIQQAGNALTLGNALELYRQHLELRAKVTTLRQAEVHFRHILRHLDPERTVESLTPLEIEELVRARRQKVCPPSVNGTLRTLRTALRLARENDLIDTLPRIKLLREQRRLPTTLTADELQTLLQVAFPESRVLLALAAYAGLRHREILHLDLEDVDLDAELIYVRAKSGAWGEWSPKSHAERTVPIGRRLREELLRYEIPASGWLFPGAGGKPMHEAFESVRIAFRGAGLYQRQRKPGLHMLRRTWASRLLTAGVDLQTLRELGGWSDIVVLQRYLASDMELKRRAVALLD